MLPRLTTLVLAFAVPLAASAAFGQEFQQIRSTLGSEGSVEDGVLRITFPRTDVKVTLAGVELEPEALAQSWFGFWPLDGGRTMLMGDVAVLLPEIQPAMEEIHRQGLEITALHNHLLGTEPMLMFMHIRGMGTGAELARKVRAVLARTSTPLAREAGEERPTRDWSEVRRILGAQGEVEGRVIEFVFPRTERLTMHGQRMPSTEALETASEFALQDLGDGRALAVGEYILREEEVNPVVRVLKEHGFTVTALHNHMLGEEPRLLFVHFWKIGAPTELARGARAALERTNVRFGNDR
jgi:hypothetical protein